MNTVNAETVEVGQNVATGGRYLGTVTAVKPDASPKGYTMVTTDLGYRVDLDWQSLDVVGWEPVYEKWRHGGWYVVNVKHSSGAVGCVSRNYPDGKWRIVCGDHDVTYPTRDAAARAERESTMVSV